MRANTSPELSAASGVATFSCLVDNGLHGVLPKSRAEAKELLAWVLVFCGYTIALNPAACLWWAQKCFG